MLALETEINHRRTLTGRWREDASISDAATALRDAIGLVDIMRAPSMRLPMRLGTILHRLEMGSRNDKHTFNVPEHMELPSYTHMLILYVTA